MSLCNGLCDRLAARMHSGGWEPPHYKRLKPELLSALEGEVLEIGPGSGVNLKKASPRLPGRNTGKRSTVRWWQLLRRKVLVERGRQKPGGGRLESGSSSRAS